MFRDGEAGPSLAEITPETLLQLTAERLPAPLASLFAREAPQENRKTLLWKRRRSCSGPAWTAPLRPGTCPL